MKNKILFLCTGNSCRSQMAEAWCRHLKPDIYDATSAGIVAKGLNPKMVQVMKEVGIDPSFNQTSKTLSSLVEKGYMPDIVITVCGHAHEHCPVFPKGSARVVHVDFDDPPELEKTAHTAEEALDHYRRVRDEIRDFIAGLPDALMSR